MVKALEGDTHLRCVCNCINLALQQSREASQQITSLINSCENLVTRFKKRELQRKLTDSLKRMLIQDRTVS